MEGMMRAEMLEIHLGPNEIDLAKIRYYYNRKSDGDIALYHVDYMYGNDMKWKRMTDELNEEDVTFHKNILRSELAS